mmetsp:Transcript_9284/g.20907  ORF Transcript_9284/g.20907 Transcript_9284/m.20907 type:complete len:209 (-) Transcript_9284:1178-1804(-)
MQLRHAAWPHGGDHLPYAYWGHALLPHRLRLLCRLVLVLLLDRPLRGRPLRHKREALRVQRSDLPAAAPQHVEPRRATAGHGSPHAADPAHGRSGHALGAAGARQLAPAVVLHPAGAVDRHGCRGDDEPAHRDDGLHLLKGHGAGGGQVARPVCGPHPARTAHAVVPDAALGTCGRAAADARQGDRAHHRLGRPDEGSRDLLPTARGV